MKNSTANQNLGKTKVGQHLVGYLDDNQMRDARLQGLDDSFMHLIGYLDDKYFEETTRLFAKEEDDLNDLEIIAEAFDEIYGTEMKLVVKETKEILFSK